MQSGCGEQLKHYRTVLERAGFVHAFQPMASEDKLMIDCIRCNLGFSVKFLRDRDLVLKGVEPFLGVLHPEEECGPRVFATATRHDAYLGE